MAIGDVIGSHPGPWWFDKDGNGTKSDEDFANESLAREAGQVAADKDAAMKAGRAAAAKMSKGGPSPQTQQAHANWIRSGGR